MRMIPVRVVVCAPPKRWRWGASALDEPEAWEARPQMVSDEAWKPLALWHSR